MRNTRRLSDVQRIPNKEIWFDRVFWMCHKLSARKPIRSFQTLNTSAAIELCCTCLWYIAWTCWGSKIITRESRATFDRSDSSGISHHCWMSAGLISERAEVTLLNSPSGPLSFIANRVPVRSRHAKHSRMGEFTSENECYKQAFTGCFKGCVPQSDWCQPCFLCFPKSCLIGDVIKCWSRLVQPFDPTWSSSR